MTKEKLPRPGLRKKFYGCNELDVEVLHFMGGEDSPRRVLCPWRAHRLASTLPAVARATAVCFLRCECLRGR